MQKKTIRDLPDSALRGKRVLVRVDFNVPLDANNRVVGVTGFWKGLPH
jgi:3-phosphoglycerate kinase